MRALSNTVHQVEESTTLALAARAWRLRRAGRDVVSLTAGEPDFPTPRHVKEAAIMAIEADFTHYTPNQGIPELIDAIVAKFSAENNLHFEPDHILVSTGAKQSIFNVLKAVCNPGDEIVIPAPYWVSYPEMVKLVGGRPVIVECGGDFRPDVRKIKRAIHAKTKALILNTPVNPSGVVWTHSELEDLALLVRDSGILVIADEIYEKLVYDGQRHVSLGAIKSVRDAVVTVSGVSKAFAMTGWRIGYLGGPRVVVEAAAKVQSQITSNPNSIAQKAALAALTGSQRAVADMVEEFGRRREFALRLLSAIRDVHAYEPQGAFYILLDVSRYTGRRHDGVVVRNSADIAQYLLDKHLIAVVPGSAFGIEGCLRLSFACSMTELEKGIARIKRGLEALS